MTRRAVLIVPVILVGAVIAGCGSSESGVAAKSAPEILNAARIAAQHAESVRVVAVSHVGGGSLRLAGKLAKDAARMQVSLLGMQFEVIRRGDTLYVKGDPPFRARLGRVLGVRIPPKAWIKGSATGPLAEIGSFTDATHELSQILGGRGTMTKGKTATIDGQPTIELKQDQKLYTGALYIAVTGEPYPALLRRTGRETGETTFTEWNKPVTVDPPAGAVALPALERHHAG